MDVNEARDSGPLVDVETRSDEELRALLEELHAEEQEVSCRRRVLHGKIDILRAELVRRLTAQYEDCGDSLSVYDVDRLIKILSNDYHGPSAAGL